MAKSYSVLLVDDDKFLLEMYRNKFEQNGATVDAAIGSEEALSKLREGAKPDILLIDIIMPTIDGLELLKIIRKEKLASGSKVIMLTNESNRSKIEEAKDLGIHGYIVKAMSIPTEVVSEVLKMAGIKLE